ncbi:MAG: NhaA family Na+:H+ antiporter [Pseudohongiellaceae bacterium]
MSAKKGILGFIQEYSLPLIAGAFAALWAANNAGHWYHEMVHGAIIDGTILGHEITLHFLINDLFMVFFFGIAAKEITDAVLPGGSLNPPSKAINPLLATLGGVIGPVAVFLLLTKQFYGSAPNYEAVANGWGVPTATDIALAWLAARMVFGAKHPAVNFLLLLAVADDAIGLGIIAVFYPDPAHPVAPMMLLFTAAGMVSALVLRLRSVQNWVPYIVVGGGLSWYGLITAHLHPALALVFIVPFLPAVIPQMGLTAEGEDGPGADPAHHDTPLQRFEHFFKTPVDYGLFLFAFANAGVEFANIGALSWIILVSLVIGKTLGVVCFSGLGSKLGFALPDGMNFKDLAVSGLIAGLGLTVALFVSGEAYTDLALQGEAKMGALFSGGVFLLAIVVGKLVGIRKVN